VTLLPAGLGIFWALAAAAAHRTARGTGRHALLATAAALAAWLTVTEYARSHVLTGFPWALPGYVWIETPVAQAAAWAGPHGLTLLTLLLTALPAIALATRGLATAVPAAAALAALAALWATGAGRLADTTDDAGRPVLRIVQPNAEQRLKWRADFAPVFYRRLLDATAAPPDPALGPPDAVIWPETAIAFLPAEHPEERLRMATAAAGVPLLLGALNREPAAGGARWSNSLFDLGPEGEIRARYDKHHLVPFGEYLPGGPILRSIGIRALAERGGFVPGPGPRLMEVPGLPPFVPLICYEAIFPHEVQAPGGRAGWMLQITNDGWFGRFAGPRQHLDQARMRAIEQGLPMVRAANTGISAVIDPHGRVLASLGLGEAGHIDARLPHALPGTRYARIGDWPALAAAFLLLLLVKIVQTVNRRA
jgi:apolipoprotein N-acyltransferase